MNFNLKTLWKDIVKDPTQRLILIVFVCVLMFSLAIQLTQSTPAPTQISSPMESADTHIPPGFVLVPIELQNAESLGGIMNGHGIVDLYSQPLQGKNSGIRVGKRLRILQAPLNPKQYAVLVPEQEAHLIVGTPGPLIAVVQNKDLKQSGELNNKKAPNRVQYYGDAK